MKKINLLALSGLCLALFFTGCATGSSGDSSITAAPTVLPAETVTPTPTNPPREPPLPTEKPTAAPTPTASAGRLKGYMNLVKNYNFEGYANPEVVEKPLKHAEELIASGTATQEDYDMALQALKDAMGMLHDGSGFPAPEMLKKTSDYPDAFTFFDGTPVNLPEDWETRKKELKNLYQYYMYGVIRNGEGETLTCTHSDGTAHLTVTNGGNSGSFSFNISTPDPEKVAMPEGGWPVIIAMGWFFQVEYANSRGYAVITYDYNKVAADNTTRTGAFYDVYPYGEHWTEQTGALAAWGWGASKIIDALEQELGAVYNINPANTILAGVSRCGKATAIAGVYDERIRISVPTCSGAGGMAMFRYSSEGQTYDLSAIGADSAYTFGDNEPLSSLQSGAERHWFNETFRDFSNAEAFPFDQHLLASLYAEENRYLFIISSYIYEDWTNPPAMWETYKEAKKLFTTLGYEDHIAFQIHKEGHAVIDEDVVALLDFADYHLYGREVETDFNKFNRCLFETE